MTTQLAPPGSAGTVAENGGRYVLLLSGQSEREVGDVRRSTLA